MRYPEYNPTMLDTGIRMLTIIYLDRTESKKDVDSYAVAFLRLRRRADASTTAGDVWDNDIRDHYLFEGSSKGCIRYIASKSIPDNGTLLYNSVGKMIWENVSVKRQYLDTLRPLCNDGEMLGLMLNYAAVVQNGYAPFAPGYDPNKRPVV